MGCAVSESRWVVLYQRLRDESLGWKPSCHPRIRHVASSHRDQLCCGTSGPLLQKAPRKGSTRNRELMERWSQPCSADTAGRGACPFLTNSKTARVLVQALGSFSSVFL